MDNPGLRFGGGLAPPLPGGLAPPMPAGLAPPMPTGLLPPMPSAAAALQRPMPAGLALPSHMPFGMSPPAFMGSGPTASTSAAAVADDASGRGKRGRGTRGAKGVGAGRGRRGAAGADGTAAPGRGEGSGPKRARGAGRGGRGGRGRGGAAAGTGAAGGAASAAGAKGGGAAGAADDEIDNVEFEDAPRLRDEVEDEAMGATHRGWFAKELPFLMYGFGDAEQPLQESVDLLEDMTVEYITGIVHCALQLGAARGSGIVGAPGAPKKDEVKIDDVLHVVRHDARKLARVRELLNKHVAIKEARKVMGDEDMGDALKTAADLGDDDDAGAGPGAG